MTEFRINEPEPVARIVQRARRRLDRRWWRRPARWWGAVAGILLVVGFTIPCAAIHYGLSGVVISMLWVVLLPACVAELFAEHGRRCGVVK